MPSPQPEVFTESCRREHTLTFSLVEEVMTNYAVQPDGHIEEGETLEPQPTGEFLLFCLPCQIEQQFHHDTAPSWARDLYDRVMHLSDEGNPFTTTQGHSTDEKAREVKETVLVLPTEYGPLVYLTNALGESTGLWSTDDFHARHLSYQVLHNGPYPLLPDEERFIAEDAFDTPNGTLLLGYSIFWQGKKYAAPTIEYYFDEALEHVPPKPPEPAFIEMVREEGKRWQVILTPLGGSVIEDFEGMDDRLCLILAVPFASLQQQFTSHEDWMQFLQKSITHQES